MTDRRAKAVADWAARRQQLIADQAERRRAGTGAAKRLEKPRDELRRWNRGPRSVAGKRTPVANAPGSPSARRRGRRACSIGRDLEPRGGRPSLPATGDALAELRGICQRALNHVNLIAATVARPGHGRPVRRNDAAGHVRSADPGRGPPPGLTSSSHCSPAGRSLGAGRRGRQLDAASPEPERDEPGPATRGRRSAATLTRPRPKATVRAFALPKLWQTLHCETWRTGDGRSPRQLRPCPARPGQSEGVGRRRRHRAAYPAPRAARRQLVEVIFPHDAVDRAKPGLPRIKRTPVPVALGPLGRDAAAAGRTAIEARRRPGRGLEPAPRCFASAPGCWHGRIRVRPAALAS